MKKSVIFTGVMLCTLPLFFSFKNAVVPPVSPDGIIVLATPIENKKAIKLRMANLLKKPVRIVIQNLDGLTLYSEKVLEHNGYRQMINLENLTPGNYVLRIMHPVESKVGTLMVNSRSVEILWNKQDAQGNYFH